MAQPHLPNAPNHVERSVLRAEQGRAVDSVQPQLLNCVDALWHLCAYRMQEMAKPACTAAVQRERCMVSDAWPQDQPHPADSAASKPIMVCRFGCKFGGNVATCSLRLDPAVHAAGPPALLHQSSATRPAP